MKIEPNDLNRLASRTRGGDPAAKMQLREQLEAGMIAVIRRTLRGGHSPLSRRIRAEFDRLPEAAGLAEPPLRSIAAVARKLCDQLVERVQDEGTRPALAAETVYG